ncbi:hypothetical protein [Citrobacter koseri]|uniref:hypothetical protein n=1 Tax=Citrobacter koseri TaxID=545 RepID=UPI00374D4FB0
MGCSFAKLGCESWSLSIADYFDGSCESILVTYFIPKAIWTTECFSKKLHSASTSLVAHFSQESVRCRHVSCRAHCCKDGLHSVLTNHFAYVVCICANDIAEYLHRIASVRILRSQRLKF